MNVSTISGARDNFFHSLNRSIISFRSKPSNGYSKLSNLRSKLSDGHPKLFMDTTIACCEHYISSIQRVSQLSVQIVTD